MRVLIVRLGSMGDVLHALPAVAALRAARPDAEIGWAIERRWTPFLASGCPTLAGVARVGTRFPQQPLVDRVHVVDTLGWRRAPLSDATWSDLRDSFRDLRAERYDVAIDFQGSMKSATVALFSGSPTRIGFVQPREKPATLFYTRLVQPSAPHIIDQNLSLLASLLTCHPERGRKSESRDLVFPLRPPAVEAFPPYPSVPSVVNGFPIDNRQSLIGNVLPIDPAAESQIERKLQALATSDRRPATAILNPGAGWPAKQWPPQRYAEVARALRDDGILSLVNYGPGEEALAREIESAGGGAAHPILCTLPELIALARRASLFIGGDTGPMHLAALLGVPVVALFGPTDPARNGPYEFGPESKTKNQKSKMVVVLRHPDSRTTTTHSSEPDPGLLQITAGQVIASARILLGKADQRLATGDQRPEFEP